MRKGENACYQHFLVTSIFVFSHKIFFPIKNNILSSRMLWIWSSPKNWRLVELNCRLQMLWICPSLEFDRLKCQGFYVHLTVYQSLTLSQNKPYVLHHCSKSFVYSVEREKLHRTVTPISSWYHKVFKTNGLRGGTQNRQFKKKQWDHLTQTFAKPSEWKQAENLLHLCELAILAFGRGLAVVRFPVYSLKPLLWTLYCYFSRVDFL